MPVPAIMLCLDNLSQKAYVNEQGSALILLSLQDKIKYNEIMLTKKIRYNRTILSYFLY